MEALWNWLAPPPPDPTPDIKNRLQAYNAEFTHLVTYGSTLSQLEQLSKKVAHYITQEIPWSSEFLSTLSVRQEIHAQCNSLQLNLSQKIQALKQPPVPPIPLQIQTSPLQKPLYFDVNPFNAALARMQTRLHPNQYSLIIEIGLTALQYKNPQAVFNQFIDGQTGLSASWGAEKATHIKANLSPHLPIQKPIAPLTIKQIADRYGFVCFYKGGPTSIFGNFALCPQGISIWGHSFQCVEAAFQWQKLRLLGVQETLLSPFFTANGEKAFELSRKFGIQPGSQWLAIRDQVMWDLLQAKFMQNPEMYQALQDTGSAYLLEHNPIKGRDTYWSDDHDGSGRNRLGELLMSIRNPRAPLPPVQHVHFYSMKSLSGLPYQID